MLLLINQALLSIKYHGACLSDCPRDRRKVWKEWKAQSHLADVLRCKSLFPIGTLRAITVDGTEWSVTWRFTSHQHIGHKPGFKTLTLGLKPLPWTLAQRAAVTVPVPVGFVLVLKRPLNSSSCIVTLTTPLVPRQSNVLVAAVHKSTRFTPCSLYNSSVVFVRANINHCYNIVNFLITYYYIETLSSPMWVYIFSLMRPFLISVRWM